MAKSFRQFVNEVAQPISQGEIDFLKKHVTVVLDYPINVEDQFTGGDIRKFTRLADYKPGQDKIAYENGITPANQQLLNKIEQDRLKRMEIIRKIFDESNDVISELGLDNDVIQECIDVLSELSEENIEYAIENNIDLVSFARKLVE